MQHAMPAPQRRSRGFTLIELMITVMIVGILAAVAYPSFMDQVRKSRRSDAITALNAVAQAQERWRANNSAYNTVLTGSGSLNIANPSSGYYTLAAAAPATDGANVAVVGATSGASYSARATAAGTQTTDTQCAVMKLNMESGTLRYYAGTSATTLNDAATNATAKRCWNR